MTALITMEDVSKVYHSGDVTFTALHPTKIEIRTGDFVCVAGPSGSGKTTLLNLMGGIDSPTSGRICINGKATGGISRKEAAKIRLENIGFVFQAFNLIPVLTVFENVEYVLLIKGVPSAGRAQIVKESLHGVGLTEHMNKRPAELSAGQQQRAAVARAIVASPPVVLADEPTGNLDSKTGEDLIGLFQKLNREKGITFVFSSHDPRIISRAGRIINLRDGQIAESLQLSAIS